MVLNIGILLLSLGVILVSAELFTNGVEWLGHRLGLSEGAVGSVLAAVGTALPETMVPIIAIIFGATEASTDIGIGAILGAPFMLGTLALFITGVAALIFTLMGKRRLTMQIDGEVMTRDLGFFLLVYTIAILAAFIGNHNYKQILAGALILAYIVYVYRTFRCGEVINDESLKPLLLCKNSTCPPIVLITGQVILATMGIVIGAHSFVGAIENLAVSLQLPAFILSILITPIATELPEKFNSVIWVSRGKDTLALGNITGAMVFQSSVIPAIGITLTPWVLTPAALSSAVLVLLSSAFIYLILKKKGKIMAYVLLSGGVFYSVFLFLVLVNRF